MDAIFEGSSSPHQKSRSGLCDLFFSGIDLPTPLASRDPTTFMLNPVIQAEYYPPETGK
jgi:hypothetical protein